MSSEEEAEAQRLIEESGISLAPEARRQLIGLIAKALEEVECEVLRYTAWRLRAAMHDVERYTQELQTSDVRRLAAELDALADVPATQMYSELRELLADQVRWIDAAMGILSPRNEGWMPPASLEHARGRAHQTEGVKRQ